MTATEKAIAILKNPDGYNSSMLIDCVKQVIGYMPTQAIAGEGNLNAKDLLTDIKDFGRMLK